MATSPKAFLVELYREYLQEASFLYEQRSGLLNDPEITWKGIGEFEERFEPHIDGLVVGEALALEVCSKQAAEGDFGELHAAVRVFCRQKRNDLVVQVLTEVDAEDPQKLQAIGDALKHEMPQAWQDEMLKFLSDGGDKLAPILATLAGYRRFKSAGGICGRLIATPIQPLPTLIWALGRLADRNFCGELAKLMQSEDEVVCSAAALALMRLGEEGAVPHCLLRSRSQNWPWLPLGLGGGRSAVKELLERSRTNPVSGDILVALGLLGSVSAVPALLNGLGNPDVANSAAMALHAITGANLSETVFIPDKVEEDELFEEERGKLKDGKPPTRPDGKPYGTSVTRLSLNRKDWDKWWSESGGRFKPDVRYRCGKLYSPATLLETLVFENSPHLLRRLACEEFVIRYGHDFVFETDMPVAEQEEALAKCSEWVKANNARFREGDWYFAGRLMS